VLRECTRDWKLLIVTFAVAEPLNDAAFIARGSNTSGDLRFQQIPEAPDQGPKGKRWCLP
jgi:hypothetical protein